MPVKTLQWHVLFLIASLAWACGPSDEAAGTKGAYEGTGNPTQPDVLAECVQDADCGTGEGCLASSGLCVALAPSSQTFSLLVDPGSGTGLLPDQYVGVPIGQGDPIEIILSQPVRIVGIVAHGMAQEMPAGSPDGSRNAPEGATPVAGRLIATAAGRIPGTVFRSEAVVSSGAFDQTWDLAELSGGSPINYVLSLLPGVSYEVAFVPDADPTGDSIPPYYYTARHSASGRLDVVLPDRDAYVKVTGVVLRTDTGSQTPAPIAGAIVSARIGEDDVGTTAVSDDEGVFSVRLSPGQGAVLLKVQPGTGSVLFPVREFLWMDGILSFADSAATMLDVGPIPATREVDVQVIGPDGDAVGSAQVLAVGVAGDGEAYGSAMTGTNGTARLSLLEGMYSLSILPPAGSPGAAYQTSLDLTPENGAGDRFVVNLGRRILVRGQVVRDATRAPLAGVVVSFMTTEVQSLAGSGLDGQGIVFGAVSDKDGQFEARVDAGDYAVTATPPVSTRLARFSQPSLRIEGADKMITLPVPDGGLVKGRVSVQAGSVVEPVPGAQVQVFFDVVEAKVSDVWSVQQGNNWASTIQLAADAISDSSGGFGAVVPILDPIAPGDDPKNGTGGVVGGDADASFGMAPAEMN